MVFAKTISGLQSFLMSSQLHCFAILELEPGLNPMVEGTINEGQVGV